MDKRGNTYRMKDNGKGGTVEKWNSEKVERQKPENSYI